MESLDFIPDYSPGCIYTGDDWTLETCESCRLRYICGPDD